MFIFLFFIERFSKKNKNFRSLKIKSRQINTHLNLLFELIKK